LIIVPGRLAVPGTFRIGCIGAVTEDLMAFAARAVRDVMYEMGVRRFGPGRASPGHTSGLADVSPAGV